MILLVCLPPASVGTTGVRLPVPYLHGATSIARARLTPLTPSASFRPTRGSPSIGRGLPGYRSRGDTQRSGSFGRCRLRRHNWPVDALKLLQFDAGISPAAATGCPAIGQAEAVVPEPPEPRDALRHPEEQAAFLGAAVDDESADDFVRPAHGGELFDVR